WRSRSPRLRSGWSRKLQQVRPNGNNIAFLENRLRTIRPVHGNRSKLTLLFDLNSIGDFSKHRVLARNSAIFKTDHAPFATTQNDFAVDRAALHGLAVFENSENRSGTHQRLTSACDSFAILSTHSFASM